MGSFHVPPEAIGVRVAIARDTRVCRRLNLPAARRRDAVVSELTAKRAAR